MSRKLKNWIQWVSMTLYTLQAQVHTAHLVFLVSWRMQKNVSMKRIIVIYFQKGKSKEGGILIFVWSTCVFPIWTLIQTNWLTSSL